MSWSTPTDFETVCRRNAGRHHYNAWRRTLALYRQKQVAELLLSKPPLARGVQAEIARALHVHRSTINRDVKALLVAARPGRPCPLCGAHTIVIPHKLEQKGTWP